MSKKIDIETQARKAVFKIYHPTPAIYIVIRIEKLFCGNDLDKEIGYYLKAKYVYALDLISVELKCDEAHWPTCRLKPRMLANLETRLDSSSSRTRQPSSISRFRSNHSLGYVPRHALTTIH